MAESSARKLAVKRGSTWLRDDRDEDWVGKYGMDTNKGFQNANNSQVKDMTTKNKGNSSDMAIVTKNLNRGMSCDKCKGGNSFSKSNIGPDQEELTGLDFEKRKRKRVRLVENMLGGNEETVNHLDSVLSNGDCTETYVAYTAQLACKRADSNGSLK